MQKHVSLSISFKDSKGYIRIYAPDNPLSYSDGYILEHILIATKALGKELPKGTIIHHIDGNRSNNANNNLVICQDENYHKLLHKRIRVLRLGGDPNLHRICSKCKQVKVFSDFKSMTGQYCSKCNIDYMRNYHKEKRESSSSC